MAADTDFNVVLNDELAFIEVQGTAEAGSFRRQQLNQMLDYAENGIGNLLVWQRQALK